MRKIMTKDIFMAMRVIKKSGMKQELIPVVQKAAEAGIEQINRRVMEKVTHLVLVTDPSRKGTQVIETIQGVAKELVMYERCGAIVNRVVNPELVSYIQIKDIPVLAYIDSDEAHAVNDIQGRSVFDLPADAPLLLGAREALQKLEII